MVDELKFTDNVDKWQLWKQDRPAYNAWFEQMSGVSADPKGAGAPVGGSTASASASTGGDE